jgi:hypothetical protein
MKAGNTNTIFDRRPPKVRPPVRPGRQRPDAELRMLLTCLERHSEELSHLHSEANALGPDDQRALAYALHLAGEAAQSWLRAADRMCSTSATNLMGLHCKALAIVDARAVGATGVPTTEIERRLGLSIALDILGMRGAGR